MSKNKSVFINKKGKKVFEVPYAASFFKEGMCQIQTTGAHAQYGYIDKSGDTVIPVGIMGPASHFSEGLALVGSRSAILGIGFINKKGFRVINVKGIQAGEFSEGLASVRDHDRNWLFINQENEAVIKPIGSWPGEDTWSIPHFREGLAPVRLNEKWGFINKEGDTVIEPMFDSPPKVSEGLIAVEKDKKWGYIDTNGSWVVEPQYEKAWPFHEDRALVMLPTGHLYAPRSSQKWKFLDKTGNIVIDFEDCYYCPSHFSRFSEGLAPIEQDNKWGFIDTQGNLVIEPEFEKSVTPHFSEGFASVKKEGKYVYINNNGKVEIETDADVFIAYNFSEGLAVLIYD